MIERSKNIKDYNTFMVPAVARYFAVAHDNDSLYQILASDEWSSSEKKMVLGGGSNILFIADYDGFMLKNEIKGIDIVHEDADSVTLRVGAGENWHDFVMWSVDRGYWGIENLALIPGTVGAAPVQNIGAYGVEVEQSIQSVEYVSLPDAEKKMYFHDECHFTYRNSIFKNKPDAQIITYVYFHLKKDAAPVLKYGRVQEVLNQRQIANPSSRDIADIIIEIRNTKLPKVGEVGMAGSFFKNPVISLVDFERLQGDFPEIPSFDVQGPDGAPMKKIPAGWILEELGYKGFQLGNVGNYDKHALVVTHNGQGTGAEVWQHIQGIITKVQDVFGIVLEPEVNIM